MTDNKFTAMMRSRENNELDWAYVEGNMGHTNCRDERLERAADWRAMREAWEAMVEALELAAVCIYSEPAKVSEYVAIALTKARGE